MSKAIVALILLGIVACTLAPVSPTTLPTPTNPWLGQSLPGSTPIPFGMSFFSNNFHSSASFTPDGTQAYWAGEYGEATIFTSRLENGNWTKPAPISFSEKMTSYRDPFISPDGMRLYFISMDPLPGSLSHNKENIWMVEKAEGGWGEPQPLPEAVNAHDLHWTVSVANNYNLYFSASQAGENNIYISKYINGKYTEAVPLGSPVNTAELEITPNIAPDESYLLFTRLANTSATPYLYISYALENGWSEPQKIENVRYCISPIITPDRMFVIYLSSPQSMEWRNTSFIDELRP
jgi:WD40-like Beta Propeller Repeat